MSADENKARQVSYTKTPSLLSSLVISDFVSSHQVLICRSASTILELLMESLGKRASPAVVGLTFENRALVALEVIMSSLK
jgi:hypothetical protein